jgi:hypothetical protein
VALISCGFFIPCCLIGGKVKLTICQQWLLHD